MSGTIATIRRHPPFEAPARTPRLTRRTPRALIGATLLALALLTGVATRAAPAAAATPCWKVLLNDWYDGRIDGTYPLHCYTDALKHLPSDVRTYSSAADDIERALQSARAAARKEHKKIGPGTLLRPAGSSGGKGGGSSGGGGGSSGGGLAPRHGGPNGTGGGGSTVTTTAPGRKPDKGFAGFADRLDPGSPSALPLPLLVLGGLAIVLVAAGAAGLVVQRVRSHR